MGLLVIRLLCLPSIKGHRDTAQVYLKCSVYSQTMPNSPVDLEFLEIDRWREAASEHVVSEDPEMRSP